MKTINDFSPADIELDACTDYHTARLNSKWTDAAADDQQAAIYRAWDYIRLQSYRTDIDIFSDGIPQDITEAVYEAAFIEIEEPGILMKTEIKEDAITSMTIGTMKISYETGFKIQFNKINALLGPYLTAPGITLTR